MGARQVATLVAALFVSAPSFADPVEVTSPLTKFYVSIPLGASTARERTPTFGIAMQGNRPYESVNIDTRMLGFGPLAVIEAKWLIAGALAAGGVYAVSRKNDNRSATYNQQQNTPCSPCGNP
jgi:hypothetical protein